MAKNDPENLSLDLGPAPAPPDPANELFGGPRYVRVGNDRRGGLVFYDYRGRRWRASDWKGPLNLDGFDTSAAAEEAIRQAPARPKAQKAIKARKLPPSAHANDLTGGSGRFFDAKGRRIGGVIHGVEGYTAWSNKRGKIGVYSTAAEAGQAVKATQPPLRRSR
jgi:hypothetical protein